MMVLWARGIWVAMKNGCEPELTWRMRIILTGMVYAIYTASMQKKSFQSGVLERAMSLPARAKVELAERLLESVASDAQRRYKAELVELAEKRLKDAIANPHDRVPAEQVVRPRRPKTR